MDEDELNVCSDFPIPENGNTPSVPSTAVKSIQDINLPTLTEMSSASYSSTVVSVCIRHIRMMQQKHLEKPSSCDVMEVAADLFFPYCDVHSSETDY